MTSITIFQVEDLIRAGAPFRRGSLEGVPVRVLSPVPKLPLTDDYMNQAVMKGVEERRAGYLLDHTRVPRPEAVVYYVINHETQQVVGYIRADGMWSWYGDEKTWGLSAKSLERLVYALLALSDSVKDRELRDWL